MRYRIFAIFILASTIAVAHAVAADSPVAATRASAVAQSRPAAPDLSVVAGLTPGSRILKIFDFEEKSLGNYEALPMYWNKVSGRGFPLYTSGKFVNDVFRSKETSFRMDLDGGSIAYRFTAGKLPINPNADYYIVGFVKTTALPHARAQLGAWFADADGKLLESTEAHSERWSSLTGNDDWHLMHFFMPGSAVGARSLVLQMGVYQPQQLSSTLGQYELYRQDIHGAVWWDDITVYQLPRLGLATNVPGNIFGPNQKVAFAMTVSDLGRDQLTASLAVHDAAGQVVYTQRWPMERSADHPWVKQVTLPLLPAGYYTASLDVVDPQTIIVRRETRFVTLAGLDARGTPAKEFGVSATRWPVEAWRELPAIAGQMDIGLVKLPAWRKDMSEESLLRKDSPFDELTFALGRADVSTIAGFADIPAILASKLNSRSGNSILALLDADTNVWKPYVSFILARYAMRVELWEIGQERDPFYGGDPRYAALYRKTFGELSSLLTTPRLMIPWNALYDFSPRDFPNAVLDLHLPALIKPAQIPAYIASFQQGGTEVLAMVDPLDQTNSRVDRLQDFVERIAFARSANPRAILIALPMIRQSSLGAADSEPDELLPVYRMLVEELGGTVFRGDINIYPGVHALLFDRSGTGTLVLWNQNSREPQISLNLALGQTPQSVSLSGARTPLAVTDGLAALTVTAAPIILDHVDTGLVQLRHSFHFALATMPAGAGAVRTTVQLSNPYTDAISGTLRMEAPPGWNIDPPSIKISLQAGRELHQPVTIRYPYSEFAGPKTIRGQLTLDPPAAASGRPLDVVTYISVSSDVVDMDCFPTFTPDGELVLQQMITNLSAEPLNAEAYAMVPGMARQQRFVLDLQPGQSAVKRFTFPNATELAGKTAALGLRQTDGRTLLVKSVPLN